MIYFLSDAHIGSRVVANPKEHQQRFIQLLQTMAQDATHIFLLGDIFDFWFEYVWGQRAKRKAFGPVLDQLKHLTQQGIEVHYFTGNHDIWTFGWLTRQTGIILHREPYQVTLHNQTLFMAHGDEFSNQLAFLRLRKFFHHPVPQFLYALLPPCVGDSFGYQWAAQSRQKELKNPIPYRGEKEEDLVQFAKTYQPQEKIDYFVFGHRHIELDLMLSSTRRVIILGDFFKQWTYATLSDKGEMCLMNYE